MKAIQTKSGQIEINDFLQAVAEEKATDIEQLIVQLRKILQQKQAPKYSVQEQEIIDKLKTGGPSLKERNQQIILLEKSVQQSLSATELEEMTNLMEKTDQWNIRRAQVLIELATRWNVSVQEVIERIELLPAPIVHA